MALFKQKFTAFALAVTAVTSVTAFGGVAHAAYPDKPIRVIVPFAPGGSTDIVARIVTQRMGAILGQTMVVENKGGQGVPLVPLKPRGQRLMAIHCPSPRCPRWQSTVHVVRTTCPTIP